MTDTTKAQILDLARKAINTEMLALKHMKETLGDNFRGADPRMQRQMHRHRHGQVGARRAQDRRDAGLDRNPEFLPASRRGLPRRPGDDLEGRRRAGTLLFGRDRRNPEDCAFHPFQRQQAGVDDGQSRIGAGEEFRYPSRRERRRGSLHPAPRADDLDHGADRHGRCAGRVTHADAGLHERRFRTPASGRQPRASPADDRGQRDAFARPSGRGARLLGDGYDPRHQQGRAGAYHHL